MISLSVDIKYLAKNMRSIISSFQTIPNIKCKIPIDVPAWCTYKALVMLGFLNLLQFLLSDLLLLDPQIKHPCWL